MNNIINDVTSLQSCIDEVSFGSVVVWTHHDLKVHQLPFKMDRGLDQIVKIRAFNEAMEVHVWRNNDELHFRKLVDDNNPSECLDTSMVLLGSVVSKIPETELSNTEKMTVKTRNYIRYNDIGQAEYYDSRFVEFK